MLRKLLAELLIQTYKEEDKLMIASCRLTQSSLVLQQSSKKGLSSSEAGQALAQCSLAIKSANPSEAKIFAQKAVHINPLLKGLLKFC